MGLPDGAVVRFTSVALSVVVLTIGATRALEAECWEEGFDEGHVVCEVCTQSRCCYTHWIDDVLEASWCHPEYPEP
jgi:hypothetical protein